MFKFDTVGFTYTTLYNFGSSTNDGTSPNSALVAGSDGALYGTTASGGADGWQGGTVFKLNSDGGRYQTLHSFGGPSDGWSPEGLVVGADGALYGTTYLGGTNYAGTVFQINLDGSGYTVLCSFGSTDGDGLGPFAALVLGSDGAFYGTTSTGGELNYGTVFKLWPPETPDMLGVTVTGASALVHFAGISGHQYQVLRSADLNHWSVVATITMPAAGDFTYQDNNLTNSAAYYRAAWVP